jgi:hypothetical protein
VHFGEREQGMDFTGLASIPISPELISICSDWIIQQAGTLQPFLGYKSSSVSQLAKPLAGTDFLPSIFTQLGRVRDCTSVIIQEKYHPIYAQLSVSEENQRLTIPTHEMLDESSNYTIDNDILNVRIQP